MNLSTLSILLGLGMGLPHIYGSARPSAFAAAVRKFPRSIPWGYALMILGTVWFLWNLRQESISDFASYKNVLLGGFAAIGIGACIFVQDFLSVRGLAVVVLVLGKLIGSNARPQLICTPSGLVLPLLAYLFVLARLWFTVLPSRPPGFLECGT